MPPHEKASVFDTALDSLMALATDLVIDASVIPEQFATWMFNPDLDEYLWKCKNMPTTDIWNSLSGDDRIKAMRRTVTRIISARATEAGVEREFSKEKLILGRLRSRMNSRLLKSRLILLDSIK